MVTNFHQVHEVEPPTKIIVPPEPSDIPLVPPPPVLTPFVSSEVSAGFMGLPFGLVAELGTEINAFTVPFGLFNKYFSDEPSGNLIITTNGQSQREKTAMLQIFHQEQIGTLLMYFLALLSSALVSFVHVAKGLCKSTFKISNP